MVQRSEHARRVLDLARKEAEGFGHRHLGPEDLVLGVLRDGGSGASRLLEASGVDLAAARAVLPGEQARALGRSKVGPELLLLGVVTDIQTPWPRCMRNRWMRQLHASVGLPQGYRGAAGPLLAAFGVDLDLLREAVAAVPKGVQR